jgi:Leucine-rich repeat (LRR) protein
MISNNKEKEDIHSSYGSDRCLRQSGDDSGSISNLSNDESRVSQQSSIESDQMLSVNAIESGSVRYLGDVNQGTYISHLFESIDLLGASCPTSPSSSSLGGGTENAVTSPNSLLRQPSHRLMKVQPIQGQPHPGAYATYLRKHNEDHDRTYLDIPSIAHEPSEESRENDSILTINPPPSEGQASEQFIVDSNIDSLQRDPWPDIEILEELFNAKLRVQRCFVWSVASSIVLGIVIGLSITMTSQLTQATASTDSCSIDHVLKGCYQSIGYQIEIPSCLVVRYQSLRQTFLEELNFNMSNANSCSSENLALLSVANSANDITYNTTIRQRYGLSLLYFATNGRLWNNQRDWLSDISYCQWDMTHVVCSSKGFVTKISLSGNNLQGSLPSNLLTFVPRLSYLDAEANSLTGLIPSDLSSLSVLKLDNNALSGAIPKSIVESDTMKVLSLSHNKGVTLDRRYAFFNGGQWRNLSLGRVEHFPSRSIPSEISRLKNLRYLDMSFSSMTGTLPSELGLLQNLTSLDISGNAILGTIPTELGNMIRLNSLILYMNDVSGTIPSEVGRLKQMKHISLDTNFLFGVIPSEICLLENLVDLSLSNNKLTGQLPEGVTNLTNLVVFKFAPNNFEWFIPSDLCELKENGNLVSLGYSNSITCVDNLGDTLCPDLLLECCNKTFLYCTTRNL